MMKDMKALQQEMAEASGQERSSSQHLSVDVSSSGPPAVRREGTGPQASGGLREQTVAF